MVAAAAMGRIVHGCRAQPRDGGREDVPRAGARSTGWDQGLRRSYELEEESGSDGDRRALHSAGRELSDVSENRAGACSHTGDAQPEHATGGWGAVMRPPTTLVSSAGQVCVPFKI